MCTCPKFLGYVLHRWPCPSAGEITDTTQEKKK